MHGTAESHMTHISWCMLSLPFKMVFINLLILLNGKIAKKKTICKEPWCLSNSHQSCCDVILRQRSLVSKSFTSLLL